MAQLYEITVEEKEGKAVRVHWKKKKPGRPKEDKKKGVYFIRTNVTTGSASDLWKVYNTIREVESTFRCLKTDLNIRPIHHQKDERIQAHIHLAVLAHQVVNTIRHQTRKAGIHDDWQNILRRSVHKPSKTSFCLQHKNHSLEEAQPPHPATQRNLPGL